MLNNFLDYCRANRERHLEQLKELLRIPSISALSAHKGDIRRAADFVADDLRAMGLRNVGLVEGSGNPLVVGDWIDEPGKPTLLLYGHYDVQPPDPLDEWLSPPFEPTERDGDLFARGAVDDKGQMFLILKAVEGWMKTAGRPPVNLKVLIEGEEETDGAMLASYLAQNGKALGADAALICDTEMFAPGIPTISTGLRGIIYSEIEVRGARTDLHSGIYGGVAPNPLQGIAEILSGLKDANGRILVPGFYDEVQPPSAAEAEAWAALPFDEESYRDDEIGSLQLTGEPGFSALERIWARPTLEVHGIRGGFVGDGAKTVIPAKASVKVSMRLVPAMDAQKIAEAFKAHVASLAPAGMRVETKILAASPSSLVSTDSAFIQKGAAALEDAFGAKTVYIRCGGSIPVVGELQRHAGIPSVLMGFGLPDDNLHAPNEKFHIDNFYQGIEAVGRYLDKLAH